MTPLYGGNHIVTHPDPVTQTISVIFHNIPSDRHLSSADGEQYLKQCQTTAIPTISTPSHGLPDNFCLLSRRPKTGTNGNSRPRLSSTPRTQPPNSPLRPKFRLATKYLFGPATRRPRRPNREAVSAGGQFKKILALLRSQKWECVLENAQRAWAAPLAGL